MQFDSITRVGFTLPGPERFRRRILLSFRTTEESEESPVALSHVAQCHRRPFAALRVTYSLVLLMSTPFYESKYFHGCVLPYQLLECEHLKKNSQKEKQNAIQNIVQKFEVKIVQHDRSF